LVANKRIHNSFMTTYENIAVDYLPILNLAEFTEVANF